MKIILSLKFYHSTGRYMEISIDMHAGIKIILFLKFYHNTGRSIEISIDTFE